MTDVSFKDEVRINLDAEPIKFILSRLRMLPFPIVITSGYEGKHNYNSKHYRHQAVDIRSKNWFDLEAKRWQIENILNSDPRPPVPFVCIIEPTHLHVQTKKSYNWPGYDYASTKKNA